MNRFSWFVAIIILTNGCKSPSREIVDSFEKVNESLQRSNSVTHLSIKELCQSIKSKAGNNDKYSLMADTLYTVTTNALDYLQKQKENLRSLDSVGENLDLASAAFIESPVGDTIQMMLERVHDYSNRMLIDKSKYERIDSVMGWVSALGKNKNWKHDYFYRTPTIAALTILTKFQNDCENSAEITLSDIYQHINR